MTDLLFSAGALLAVFAFVGLALCSLEALFGLALYVLRGKRR